MEEIIKKHAKILDDKKAQTTNKIKYVSKYVENWLYVMANAKFSEGINFIDCMCNAGIYLDGDFCTSIEVLKLFVASAAIHKDKTFNLYFNDYSEERISVLKEVIAKVYKTSLQNLHIYISQKDVNEYLSCLSRETKRFLYPQATILYVDPYDFGTVHIPTLRTFCEKFYCELLFNLFTSDWVRNRNNELDSRIDKVIDNPKVKINNKTELVDYMLKQLKVGRMQYSFNYEFHTETNVELYQIMYLTPKDTGLEKLKDALWDTFKGASYYRNHRKKKENTNQLSLFTPEFEEQLEKSTEQYIISCNVEQAIKIIDSLSTKKHLSYNDLAIPILEKTMLKKSHLKTNLFEPLIKEGKLVKLNENVRKNNYTADFYDIKG